METLLLSSTWEPIGRVDWQRAMTLWYSGRAEVIDAYASAHIRTANDSFAVPSVLRYLRGRLRRVPTVRFSRTNVFARDGGLCQYCGLGLRRSEATYDHVVPRRAGGKTTWDNIVLCCLPCNQRKGGRTPHEAAMHLRSVPSRPRLTEPEWFTGLSDERMPDAWRPYIPASRR